MPTASFQLISRNGLSCIVCNRLAEFEWLVHAFGTRVIGRSPGRAPGLSPGHGTGNRPDSAEKKQPRSLGALAANDFDLAWLRQVHSARIVVARRRPDGGVELLPAGPSERCTDGGSVTIGDGLLSSDVGILLAVYTADCMPILLVDQKMRAVAAVHAGWRGALERIAQKAVGEMRRVFGSEPSNLIAALGPSIRSCCYEVGEEVMQEFCSQFADGDQFFLKIPPREPALHSRHPSLFPSPHPPGREPGRDALHLDLVAALRSQLLTAGLRPQNICVADYCTASRTDLFYSHRKEGPGTGRMIAVAGIRPSTQMSTRETE